MLLNGLSSMLNWAHCCIAKICAWNILEFIPIGSKNLIPGPYTPTQIFSVVFDPSVFGIPLNLICNISDSIVHKIKFFNHIFLRIFFVEKGTLYIENNSMFWICISSTSFYRLSKPYRRFFCQVFLLLDTEMALPWDTRLDLLVVIYLLF